MTSGEIPQGWQNWLTSRSRARKKGGVIQNLPGYVKARGGGMVERALANLRDETATAPEDLAAALEVIPNPTRGWDRYNTVLMTIWASCAGAEWGRELARRWSRKNALHTDEHLDERWAHYERSPPRELGFGSLVHLAREVVPEWEAPSRVRREVFPDWGDCLETVPTWEVD